MNESRAQVEAELADEQLYEPQQSERLKDHIRKKSELDVSLVEVEERWFSAGGDEMQGARRPYRIPLAA